MRMTHFASSHKGGLSDVWLSIREEWPVGVQGLRAAFVVLDSCLHHVLLEERPQRQAFDA